ncbi:MAG: HPr(Ser) kinase/phosphatase [Firmicutes bacterium]|nr:HPr(Ser) kinase/phosphatase [Bacillota bacterium]MCL1953202.1 HPr(Ser) kinase/phosphatase [Bacillota bacterium]
MSKQQQSTQSLSTVEFHDPVKVKVSEFCSHHNLEIVYPVDFEEMEFVTFNINRPGLLLTGFRTHFVHQRIQVLGEMEVAYIMSLSKEQRVSCLDRLFEYDIPCIILSNGKEPFVELLTAAKKHNKLLLLTKLKTTVLINQLSFYLNELLAKSQVVHAVLVDLYGIGVMIMGDSGVGKSEAALELVQRNHMLVADDAVQIKCINDVLVGQSPPITKHFMEIRGIGIVDIRNIYGAGAVSNSKVIDIVIHLEDWDPHKQYDRVGTMTQTYTILGKTIPKYIVPVKPGRNIAIILEVAARNHRLRTMGYDAIKELEERMK